MMNGRFFFKLAAVAASVALVAGCSGSHSSVIPAPQHRAQHAGNAQAILTIKIPRKTAASASRRPAYISSSTQSVSFAYAIGTTAYPAQTLDVTPGSPGCSTDSNGNTECTLSFAATAGDAVYTVSAFDGQNGTGSVLASAQASMTMVAGQDNRFAVTLDGVPKTFDMTLAQSSVTAGTPADVALTIAAYDVDGGLIVNSPAFWDSSANSSYGSVTVAVSDTSEFTVEQNGTTLSTASGDASSYIVPAPFTGLSVHYTGSGRSVGTFTLDAQNVGIAAQALLQVQAPPPTITEYAVPLGTSTQAKPFGIAADSSGNVWFTDNVASAPDDSSGTYGSVTADGTITMHALNGELDGGMALGPDGNFWLAGHCYLGGVDVISTAGVYLTNYQLPEGHGAPCTGGGTQIVSGAGGDLWFTEGQVQKIGRITTAGSVTEYSLSSDTVGIANGPDGNMWFTEKTGQKVAKVTPDGQITEYPLPPGDTPLYITSGIDGNLWFTETGNLGQSQIGKMTTAGVETDYPVPYSTNSNYAPGGIVAGPDGNLWYGDNGLIGKIDPSTGSITTFDAGKFECLPSNEKPLLFTVASANTMWFTDQNGCIGKIVVN